VIKTIDTTLDPNQPVQMLYTTWMSFQWWFTLWQCASLIEAVIIIALIIYLGWNRWKPLGQLILHELKSYNEAVCRAQREQGTRKEISPFSIGKFWAFVFGGLFTLFAGSSVLIMGYFAAVGEGIETNNSTALVQIAASNDLLSRMHYLQVFLLAVFIISVLVIFRGYIEVLIWKMQEKGWVKKLGVNLLVFRVLRYLILFLFTAVSFVALYNAAVIFPYTEAGVNALTHDIPLQTISITSMAFTWCNLAGMIGAVAFIFLAYWICSVWLMAFGYLLRDELNWLWEKFKQLLKYLYHGLFPVVL
jgi:hypothetical protein